FNDIRKLMTILYSLLKKDGVMILSDFHPLRKCIGESPESINYFDEQIQDGDIAYKHFFNEDEQKSFPHVSIKSYTLSEIINSIVTVGFTLTRFDEHKGWDNENIPWEFTILANK
ncbi:hypothetical protein, partial [Pseudomonas sp. 2995-1]|uniref:hypothetical protein n=1 Tax=Pseudomonas sp. 2995-1 TaxID=1712679 RepID=UPI000C66CF9F